MFKFFCSALLISMMFWGNLSAFSAEKTVEDVTIYIGGDKPSPELAEITKKTSVYGQRHIEYITADKPDMQAIRANSRAQISGLTALPPEKVMIEETMVGALPAFWVYAPAANAARRLLYLHGGAYIMGTPETYAKGLLAWLAVKCDCAILAVDYHKAPEHPFPAALDDALEAYTYLLENGPKGKALASRMFIAGDSAGGGLTLAAAYAIRDGGMRQADALVPIGAWLDIWSLKNGDRQDQAVKKIARLHAAMYVGDDQPDNPLISPLYGDVTGLPPMLLQLSEPDYSLLDHFDYVEKLLAAGVDVQMEIWRHMPHVWQAAIPALPEAVDAVDHIVAYLNGWP